MGPVISLTDVRVATALSSSDVEVVAEAGEILHLLTHSREWVLRRTETVELHDAVSCRRTQLVHFALPRLTYTNAAGGSVRVVVDDGAVEIDLAEDANASAPDVIEPRFLPLFVVAKQSRAANLTLRGADGAHLTWLPRDAANVLVSRMMCIAAEGVLDDEGILIMSDPTRPGLDRNIIAALGEIVCRDAREAEAHYKALELRAQSDANNTETSQLRALFANAAFTRLLRIASSSLVLLLPSQACNGTSADHLTATAELSYTTWLRWGPRDRMNRGCYVYLPPGTRPFISEDDDKPTRRMLRKQWFKWRVFYSLGWLQPTIAVKIGMLGHCQSYHFVVNAPEGLYTTRATLLHQNLNNEEMDPVEGDVGGDNAHVYFRPHYFPRRPLVALRFCSTGRGFVRHAAYAAGIAAIILTICLAFLDKLIVAETSAAATLLIAVPTISLGFLIRPQAHELPRDMESGIRFCLFSSAGALYAAALTLLLARDAGQVIIFLWSPAVAVAWFFAWLLAKSMLTQRRFVSRMEENVVEALDIAQVRKETDGIIP